MGLGHQRFRRDDRVYDAEPQRFGRVDRVSSEDELAGFRGTYDAGQEPAAAPVGRYPALDGRLGKLGRARRGAEDAREHKKRDLKAYWLKLLGTAGSWFIFDVVFYVRRHCNVAWLVHCCL